MCMGKGSSPPPPAPPAPAPPPPVDPPQAPKIDEKGASDKNNLAANRAGTNQFKIDLASSGTDFGGAGSGLTIPT